MRLALLKTRRTSLIGLSLFAIATASLGCNCCHTGWTSQVATGLNELIATSAPSWSQPARPIAVFDFDNTIIHGDISFSFLVLQAENLEYGFEPGSSLSPFPPELDAIYVQLRQDPENADLRRDFLHGVLGEYEHAWADGRAVEACGYLARLLTGLPVEQARDLGRRALKRALNEPTCIRQYPSSRAEIPALHQQSGIRYRTSVVDLIKQLKSEGFDIWVASASPQPMVEAAAATVGIAADHVLAVRTKIVDGRLTGEVVEPVTYRQGKVSAIMAAIGRHPDLAVGDAWTDFEMMKTAKVGILIDKGDRELAESAKKAGILVQPMLEKPLEACE